MTSSQDEDITHVPAPWMNLKGTIYTLMMYNSSKDAQALKDKKSFLYSPLEVNSPFSDGNLVGGLGMAQVVRYYESPVGPYDELLVVPGEYEYLREVKGKDGKVKVEKKRNLRITRIYVSTKEACWNGRHNWNIPKHIARFEFKDFNDGSVSIAVYPHDINPVDESKPSSTAFFKANFKLIPYLPNFPVSTGAARYLGLDLSIAQPPLPQGTEHEITGTDRWSLLLPLEYSSKTSLGWWELKQGAPREEDPLLSGHGHRGDDEEGSQGWWPGMGRWRIGLKMEEATLDFEGGEYWKGTSQ